MWGASGTNLSTVELLQEKSFQEGDDMRAKLECMQKSPTAIAKQSLPHLMIHFASNSS